VLLVVLQYKNFFLSLLLGSVVTIHSRFVRIALTHPYFEEQGSVGSIHCRREICLVMYLVAGAFLVEQATNCQFPRSQEAMSYQSLQNQGWTMDSAIKACEYRANVKFIVQICNANKLTLASSLVPLLSSPPLP
jgi:hypothetical protein